MIVDPHLFTKKDVHVCSQVRFQSIDYGLSNSHCRTLSHGGGLSPRGWPRPSWWPLCHVVGAEASDGLHSLISGLQFSLGLQRPRPPSRPPHVDPGKRERGFTEVIILAPRLGFPTGFRSSPIHSVLPHQFLPFQGQGESHGTGCAPVCCGHPTGQTGEEINTLL